jgi:hypothetical protein
MYYINHNQDVVELLEKLRELRAEYPIELLSARRVSFLNLLNHYVSALM